MPTTNSFDRKLAAVLKSLKKGVKDATAREKIGKDFHAVRSRVVDAGFGGLLDGLFKALAAPVDQQVAPDVADCFTTIRALCDRQFSNAAGCLFFGWREIIAKQPLDTVLPVAPDAASFEIWRKAASWPAKEVEQTLLAAPATTYITAGADWLLPRISPEKQLALLDLLLTRQPRPKHLPAWSEALANALQKDKRAALLQFVLQNPWPDQDRVVALAEVVRGNPVLMKPTIDALPEILTAKAPPPAAIPFVRHLFQNLIATANTERQFMTASLARLGTGILLHHAIGPCAFEALAFVAEAASQLRGVTRDPELQARTWVLEDLTEHPAPSDARLHITLEGARRFSVAFEKAAQDFPAADILAMTARNLGLVPIGIAGKAVTFDPLQHEDVDGGMVPGDSASVESQGWTHGNNVILRARVRKAKG